MPYRLRQHRIPAFKNKEPGYEELASLRKSLRALRDHLKNDVVGRSLFRDFFHRCLDYWAAPDTILPDPDLFDMMNRVVNWKPSPAIKKFWKEKENG